MKNYKVILTPKGLIAMIILFTALGLGIAELARRTTKSDTPPVGAIASPAVVVAADSDEYKPAQAELDERALIADWNRQPGQSREWLFLGPVLAGSAIRDVSNTEDAQGQMTRIINTTYLPDEAKYQAKEGTSITLEGKSYTWRKSQGCAFDFKTMLATPEMPIQKLENVVVYGVTYVDSKRTEKKKLRIRSDDGAVIWVNGQELYRVTRIRGLLEEDQISVELRPGRNTILVKVGQGGGGWGLVLYLEDAS